MGHSNFKLINNFGVNVTLMLIIKIHFELVVFGKSLANTGKTQH